MPKRPEVTVHALPEGHEVPKWEHLVHVNTGTGLVAPMAACRSPYRAELVAEALRRMLDLDPTFADRVTEASLAERRAGVEHG